jgi:DNA-binding NtrC family response regulator
MARILLAEDEVVIRAELRRLLQGSGHEVTEVGSVPEALAALAAGAPDLIITDVRLPGPPGTQLIESAGGAPVLVMTSYATVRSAVDAMKLGAAEYVAKPFDLDEFMAVVERLLAGGRRSPPPPPVAGSGDEPIGRMLGQSAAMSEVFAQTRKVAPSDTTVLVLGESGTGKELVARELHTQSRRKNKAFVAINCAQIPENLVESELFGHEQGAFTGAVSASSGVFDAADGGTLFLDEIGELPTSAQARLLRVLQTGEVRKVGSPRSTRVDVRLIAATHRDLAAAVREGSFRSDLYYRLRVFEIRLPPLRDRGNDALLLAHAFLAREAEDAGKAKLGLSPEAERAIETYGWPGNVRELENAIERAVILCEGDTVLREHLGIDEPPVPSQLVDATAKAAAAVPSTPGDPSLEAYFRRFVLENQGTLGEAELAKRLGISRKTLWERRQRMDLPRKR